MPEHIYATRIWRAIQDDGSILWPERFSYEWLMNKRSQMPGFAFSCTPGESPVLMADWTMRPIRDVREGDEVIGFTRGTTSQRRRLVRSTVEATFKTVGRPDRVRLASGVEIRCTPDHRWFTGRNPGDERRSYAPIRDRHYELKYLHRVLAIPARESGQDRDWGYLAAIIDGEGACKYGSINITQSKRVNGPVFEKIGQVLDRLAIPYGVSRSPKGTDHYWLRGGRDVKARILANADLAKASQIAATMWAESKRPIQLRDRIVDVQAGTIDEPVYALKTSTGNYVVWGYASANSEYLNDPQDPETRKFRAEWVNWYTTADLHYDQKTGVLIWKKQYPLRVYAGVDQAIEEKEDKAVDESAIVVVGVTADRQCLILYVWHDRVDFPAQVKMVRSIAQNFSVSMTGIEKAAYQRALAQQILHDAWMPINQLENTTPKYERITSMSVAFEQGRVYMRRCADDEPGTKEDELGLVRLHPNMEALYLQLMQFPTSGHDDLPDALNNALVVASGIRAFEPGSTF